jgi:hypothetical protein
MPTYNAQGQYVDEQGNPAPDPADASPGISQGIANLFGTSYTPGRSYTGPSDEYDPSLDSIAHAPQALESGKSGWGTYMPIQKGVTGGTTPIRGINEAQLATQQSGVQTAMPDDAINLTGDPEFMDFPREGTTGFGVAENIGGRSIPVPTPEPTTNQVPGTPTPSLDDVVFDDDRTSPHEYRLGERQQRRDLRQADPDYWGMGGAGDDSIIGSIMDLFRPDPITEVYDDDFTSGTAARAARREQEKAIDADNQGVTSPTIDTPPSPTRRGPRRGPQNRNRPQTEALPPQLQAPEETANIPVRGRRPTQSQAVTNLPTETPAINPNPRARITQSSDLPQEVTAPVRTPVRGRGPDAGEAGPSILNWIMSQLSQSPTEAAIMDNVVPQVPTRGTAPRVSPRTGGRDVRPPT